MPALGLAFHYRFPDCIKVRDKLVMSKVKLYPGHCNSVHLSKKGGENGKEGVFRDSAVAKRWLYKEEKWQCLIACQFLG